jgi:hypothetical protein
VREAMSLLADKANEEETIDILDEMMCIKRAMIYDIDGSTTCVHLQKMLLPALLGFKSA